MKKYFIEKEVSKISLSECYIKIEEQYQKIEEKLKEHSTGGYATQKEMRIIDDLQTQKRELSLSYARVKHIYKALGDVLIREDLIDILSETFDYEKCRYGTICLKLETVKTMYEISEMFPELSKEAIVSISRIYIKDLFEKYSLIDTLAVMLRKDKAIDSTFESYMDKVTKLADQEDRQYKDVAWYIRIHCGEYTYDFVRHYEQFVQEHHISWERFCECLPSAEIILKDQLELKSISERSKDCWSACRPITFQMLDDYLDGDIELSQYDEQPMYLTSPQGEKILTTFTKTDFLESIKGTQKKLRK